MILFLRPSTLNTQANTNLGASSMLAQRTIQASYEPTSSDTFLGSVAVEQAHTKTMFVFDKDGTIKNDTLNASPSQSELSARAQIRKISSQYVEITATAQTPEMGMSTAVYQKSVEAGFDRPPVNWIRSDDGFYSYQDPDTLPEFNYLHDFAGTNNFGYGVGVLNGGKYLFDREYDQSLGGPNWRPEVLEAYLLLGNKYPELELLQRLAPFEFAEHYFMTKRANVAPLPYRIQTDWLGIEGLALKEKFALALMAAQMLGTFPKNVVLVDESNPHKGRYTTYLVPKQAQKHRAMARLGSQISYHSSVPLSEFKAFTAGDTWTDLQLALWGFQGVKDVFAILAGGSRVAESLYQNKLQFAGRSLGWARRHEELPPRFVPGKHPGEFIYRAHKLVQQHRTVILADYAPYSKGLLGAQSVLACLHHLGYK